VHEPRTTVDGESPLAYSMEGAQADTAALIPFFWSPGWNSNQAVTRFQQEVGGALRGGDAGVRLVLRGATTPQVPMPRAESAPGLKLLPLYDIFGSDELSAYTPAIVERMRTPYVVLNPFDAERLDVTAGDGVRCTESARVFAVRLDAGMTPGCAGYLRGLPGSWTHAPIAVRFVRDPGFKAEPNVIARG